MKWVSFTLRSLLLASMKYEPIKALPFHVKLIYFFVLEHIVAVTRLFDEVGLELSMFLRSCVSKGSFFSQNFHVGKCFSSPIGEDIVFKAICVNIKIRRWSFLDQMSEKLTSSLVTRVVCELRDSPQLALEFYNWVRQKRSVLHSLGSSCGLIHALVNSRRFDDALSLMGDLMCVEGISPLEVLDALIDSYGKTNSSISVFDALVRACTLLGDTNGAYEVIKKLQMEGFWVTIHAWNNFLSHLLKSNEIGRFWQVYKEMVSYGYIENVNTFNLVIHALCKEYKLLEAMSVFYRSLKGAVWPNIVTFNMIINGACTIGDMHLALKLFRKIETMAGDGIKPNVVTYNSVINGFCKIQNMAMAEEIRNEMQKMDIKPNVQTYATLIDGYLRAKNSEEALRLCDELVDKGLIPNSVVYNSVIHSLYGEGDIDGASLLLSDMIEKQIQPDEFTQCIITDGLCRYGYVKEAFQYHIKDLERNLFSHNSLIHYFCRRNNLAATKQLLARMFVHGMDPDVVTFGTLIDRHCKAGSVETAVQIYEKMIAVEKKPNLLIYNMVVNGLCKQGLVHAASSLVHVLRKEGLYDTVTYNTLVNGFCSNGKMNELLSLGEDMINAGVVPTTATYNTLINYLCKLGCLKEAKELMKKMVLHGVIPDCVTYTTLITSSKNCPEDIISLHDYMVLNGVTPDARTYKAIVRPILQEENL